MNKILVAIYGHSHVQIRVKFEQKSILILSYWVVYTILEWNSIIPHTYMLYGNICSNIYIHMILPILCFSPVWFLFSFLFYLEYFHWWRYINIYIYIYIYKYCFIYFTSIIYVYMYVYICIISNTCVVFCKTWISIDRHTNHQKI